MKLLVLMGVALAAATPLHAKGLTVDDTLAMQRVDPAARPADGAALAAALAIALAAEQPAS
jgi:hypothetical protein